MSDRELFTYILEYADYMQEEFEIVKSSVNRLWLGIKAEQEIQPDLDNIDFHLRMIAMYRQKIQEFLEEYNVPNQN